MASTWLTGPLFLASQELHMTDHPPHDVELPESIKETSVLVSKVPDSNHFFEKLLTFSSWKKMVGVAAMAMDCIVVFAGTTIAYAHQYNMQHMTDYMFLRV